jgi:cytochrome c peroxidase
MTNSVFNRKSIGMLFGLFILAAFTTEHTIPENDVALGKALFFDPILSADRTVSCASCHKPEHGFADILPFSYGVDSTLTTRNTPSVKNVLFRSRFFWDGRASSLEQQALMPITNPDEMNLPLDQALERLRQSETYSKAFLNIYKRPVDTASLAAAIAAYERTLESTFTPFDLWMEGQEDAVSESAKRGKAIFIDKANCFECHFGPDFTQDEMLNIGIYDGKKYSDPGLAGVTNDRADLGKFKVPSLRNIAQTAPYMHNGMFKTLREVIEYYNNPEKVIPHPVNVSDRLKKPLNLSAQEKEDLLAFLMSLSDKEVANK